MYLYVLEGAERKHSCGFAGIRQGVGLLDICLVKFSTRVRDWGHDVPVLSQNNLACVGCAMRESQFSKPRSEAKTVPGLCFSQTYQSLYSGRLRPMG